MKVIVACTGAVIGLVLSVPFAAEDGDPPPPEDTTWTQRPPVP